MGEERIKRFLFISDAEGLPWGGSEVLWAKVAHALLKMGHHVAYSYQYYVDEPCNLADLRVRGAVGYYRGDPDAEAIRHRIDRYLKLRDRRQDYTAFSSPHWLLSLVMLEQPDFVVLNGCNAYGLADYAVPCRQLQQQQVPYAIICQLENEAYLLSINKRKWMREVFGGAVEVSFGSEFGANLVRRQLALPMQNIQIFDNPPNGSGNLQPWPPGCEVALRMACVGRLDVTAKGQDVLLAALASPAWKNRDWQLTFYGKGAEEAHLKNLVSMYDLGHHIHFAGFVPGIDAVWAQEHICLQPSPKEGTPMTVVEAMAAGRPCLVSDIGRMPDLIEEGKTGWVCSRGVASVSAALERAWIQRDQWREMGEAAYAKIKEVWNFEYPEQMAERLVAKATGLRLSSSRIRDASESSYAT